MNYSAVLITINQKRNSEEGEMGNTKSKKWLKEASAWSVHAQGLCWFLSSAGVTAPTWSMQKYTIFSPPTLEKNAKPPSLQPMCVTQRGSWDLILCSQLPAMRLNFCSSSLLRNPDPFNLFVLTRQKAAQLPSCLQNRDEMHWKISSQPRFWWKQQQKKRNRKLVKGG